MSLLYVSAAYLRLIKFTHLDSETTCTHLAITLISSNTTKTADSVLDTCISMALKDMGISHF